MRPDASRWFARRTLRAGDAPSARTLVSLAGGRTASVVIPALDEEPTVGAVVASVRPLVEAGLVDELLVVDGGSRDGTVQVARSAGARVVSVAELLPAHGSRPGKGESMWKALEATDGDLVVYLDADVLDSSPGWVAGLLWPLLAEPDVSFVKACYDRPLAGGGVVAPTGGGRVTELSARPLLDLLHPALAGFVQPLAGECAATRSLLESLPFSGGYAVEIGLLLDAYDAVGLEGMAQVDLGSRRHRNRDTADLGRMSATVVAEVLARTGVELRGGTLTQFVRDDEAYAPSERAVTADARPPMQDVPEYAARRARAS
ncbi:MAG TPA: glucosyl-3-phosphoglycerate synthase [Mycobacteriales bacterium]